MSDPVSILASALGIATSTLHLMRRTRDVWSTIRDASAIMSRIEVELNLLIAILQNMKDSIASERARPGPFATGLEAIGRKCYELVTNVSRRLDKLENSTFSSAHRVMVYLKQEGLELDVNKLSRMTGLLQALVNKDSLYVIWRLFCK